MGIIVALKVKNGEEEFIAIDPKEDYKDVSILCPFCRDNLIFVKDRENKYFWKHKDDNKCKKFPKGVGVDNERKICEGRIY